MLKLNKSLTGGIILPLVVMMLWGSLFPFIKIGYKAFNIDTSNVADILIFAAFRFFVCGAIVCLIAYFKKEKIEMPKIRSISGICIMGIFTVVLHYGFLYIGLTQTESSKAAILKQLGPLVFACLSFLFIKDEKFSVAKIICALVGFCGIIAINAGTGLNGFSIGDILVLAASFCTVVSMIISNKNVRGTSPFWVTGISQLFGGVILFAIAMFMGGKIPTFNITAFFVFAYICTASIVSYTLFYYVQRTTELSKLFIIKFAEPLFACIFGAILLGENILKIQYLLAFICISLGISYLYFSS